MKALIAGWVLAAMSGLCSAEGLIFAISEGSSGGTDHARVIAKYSGLADVLAKTMKQSVQVVFIREFSALESGLQEGRFDFAMARPSDYPARGMRDYGYKYVATAQPDGQCLIVVPKASTLKTVADIKGRKVVTPNPAAYMTKFCEAELRRNGVDLSKEQVQRVREQGAVIFYVKSGFAEVGAVASYSGVAKTLDADGMRVLHASVKQPYFPLIAGKKVTSQQVASIQKDLVGLTGSDAGQGVLKQIGIKGFDTTTEPKLRELLAWLGL